MRMVRGVSLALVGVVLSAAGMASGQENPQPAGEGRPAPKPGLQLLKIKTADGDVEIQEKDAAARPAPLDPADLIEDEGVKDVEKQVLERWEKLDGFAAKVKTLTGTGLMIKPVTEDGEWQYSMVEDGRGEYSCLKKNTKLLVRMDMGIKSPFRYDDSDELSRYSLTRIFDGQLVYSYAVSGEIRRASKQPPHPRTFMILGGQAVWDQLRSIFVLKKLDDEKLGERDAFVIRGLSTTGEQSADHWFDKKTGVLVKITMYEKRGRKPTRTILFEDLEENPKFADDHFVFTVPEGVTIEDQTTRPTPGQAAARSAAPVRPAEPAPSPPIEPAKPAPAEQPAPAADE